MNIDRRLRIIGIVFVLLVIGFFVFKYFTSARLVINTVDGARIELAEEVDGEFKDLGETSARYSNPNDIVVYVQVSLDGSVSQKSVQLESGTTKEVDISIEEVRGAERFAQGPLADFYIDGEFAFGINPDTQSLTYTPKGADPGVSFIAAPYVRKVDWVNRKNFIFLGFGEGVGYFLNGEKKEFAFGPEGSFFSFIDYTRFKTGEIVLIDSSRTHSLSKLSSTSIVERSEYEASSPRLMNDNNFAYLVSPVFEDDSSTGGNFDNDNLIASPSEPLNSTLYVLSKKGDIVNKLSIDVKEEIFKVIEVPAQNSYAVLGDSGLVFVDKDTGDIKSELPFYFQGTKDLLFFGGSLITLTSDGLWRYDTEDETLYKLASFAPGEEYTPNSLDVIGGDLFYSSQLTREALFELEPQGQNSIYRLQLN